MTTTTPQDARLFRALAMFSTIRKIDAEIPAHIVEALLKVYNAETLRGEPMTTN